MQDLPVKVNNDLCCNKRRPLEEARDSLLYTEESTEPHHHTQFLDTIAFCICCFEGNDKLQ
jgi:hypothetical protein